MSQRVAGKILRIYDHTVYKNKSGNTVNAAGRHLSQIRPEQLSG